MNHKLFKDFIMKHHMSSKFYSLIGTVLSLISFGLYTLWFVDYHVETNRYKNTRDDNGLTASALFYTSVFLHIIGTCFIIIGLIYHNNYKNKIKAGNAATERYNMAVLSKS